MKKRLSETQFQGIISKLDVGPQTTEIAHGVLVEGYAQSEYTTRLGISKGAVSQAVNRVWQVHLSESLPEGFEKVTAVLPKHQAYIVKKWAEAAKDNQDKKS